MCKIAIIESFSLFSAGIKSILKDLKEVKVIAEAENVDLLIPLVRQNVPDLICFDVIHSGSTGIKPLKKIRRLFPKTPVLIIINANYADFLEEYIHIGIKGCVFSNAGSEELLTATNNLKAGNEYFPIEVWKILKNAIQSRKSTSKKSDKLTDREIAVLKLFTQGLTYKEIGLKLNISSRTVETHKNNILSKLKIHTIADMIKYAYHNELLT